MLNGQEKLKQIKQENHNKTGLLELTLHESETYNQSLQRQIDLSKY